MKFLNLALYSVLVTFLWSFAAWSQDGKNNNCYIYSYINENGQIVTTNNKKTIPAQFHDSFISTKDCKRAKSLMSAGGKSTKPVPSFGRDEHTASSVNVPAKVFSSKHGKYGGIVRKIFSWFAFTEAWMVALSLFFGAAILAGTVGLVVTAFRSSTLWGLASLLPPFAILYLLLHWGEVWPSAMVWITGVVGGSIMVFFVLSLL